jgi:Secretion system C-terminal sorting domain
MKQTLLKMISACLPLGIAYIVTVPIVPIAIGIGIMFSASANAQIVYTDVIPDSIKTCTPSPGSSCSSTYQLDLNNDGISDFQLYQFHWIDLCPVPRHSSYVSVSPLGSNKVACESTSIGICPLALANGVVIQNNNWYSTSGLKLEEHLTGCSGTLQYTCSNWYLATDKYLGLKLIVGSNTYYGWVRLDVAQFGTSFTIKDYAYNSIPNQPILAGQTIATGIIENSFASSINFFPNPANNHLTIDLGSNYKKSEVTITDITGNIIPIAIGITTADYPDSHLENKIDVNTSEFAKGIYVVRIQSGDLIGTKKLVVEK